MKNLLFLIFLLLATTTQAQNIPQNPNKIDKNNLKQGKWTTFYNVEWQLTTQKDSIMYYAVGEMKDNQKNGTWTFFEAKKGTKMLVMPFVNGQENGLSTAYQSNGQINSQGIFTNGMRQGIWYYYHPNGKLRKEIMIRNNVKIGVEKEYDETGKLTKEIEYENGKPKQKPAKPNQTWGERYEEGKMYLKKKEYDKAIIIFETVRLQTEKEVGKNHQYYAKVLNDLALAYEMNKQFDKAKALYLEILAIQERDLGKEHVNCADTRSNLASVQFNLGDLNDAETNYLKALAIYQKTLGKTSGSYIQVEKNLAYLREKKSKK